MAIGMSLSIFDKDGNLALLLDGNGIKLLLDTYLSFGLDQFNEEILLKLVASITKGSILYGLRNDVLTTLAPNTSLTRKYLSQIGDGSGVLDTTWETVAGSGQTSIQFQDEGTNLGAGGTVNTVNFTGTGVTASRLLDTVTVNVTSGGGSGDVVGPASSVNNNVVFFNGTTGKIIKDSGLTLAGSNTGDQTSIVGITGTTAQFNTALTDNDFATQAGVETLTNKTVALGSNTVSGTKAQFDTALTDGNFLYVGDVTQYTDEQAQDAVGTILTDTNSVNFTYTDATPSITADVLVRNTTTANTTITASGVGVDVNADTVVQRVEVVKNSGAVVGTRKQLNFIEGSNVTLTVADDVGNNQVDITVASAIGPTDGDKGDITVSGSGATWTIDNDVVTNAKLANVATATLKGRVTAATGDPEDLTGTQATTLLDVFTSALKGLAPASGGGATNFLRADGTWNAPAGSGQTAVQFRDEGTNLGTSGTVDVLDFVGAGVTATRSTNTVTVTVSGGSGITQDQILNLVTFRA